MNLRYSSPFVTKYIGRGFVRRMTETPYIEVLGKSFTREDVGALGCYNFAAARRFAKACHDLQISTPKDLRQFGWSALYDVRGVGDATMFAALHILDALREDVVEFIENENGKAPPKTKKKPTATKTKGPI